MLFVCELFRSISLLESILLLSRFILLSRSTDIGNVIFGSSFFDEAETKRKIGRLLESRNEC